LASPIRGTGSARPAERSAWTIVAIAIAFALAVAIDYRALTPYVMTPLYAVPILLAAWRLPPRAALAVAVLANVVDVASALIQGTPREIWALYGLGLVLVGGLAVLVAEQRLLLVRRGLAIAAANRRLAAQYAVGRGLAEAATVDEAVERTLRALGEELAWAAGAFWRLDESGMVLHCARFWQEPGLACGAFEAACRPMSFRPGAGLPGRVWSAGRPLWIEEVATDPNFPRAEVARQVGLHSAVGFPVHLDERTFGVIETFSTDVRAAEPDWLAALEAIGSQLGQFIERKRVEEERERVRRVAEQRARQLAEYERVIAHDIRQPLTVARAHAALLRREIDRGDLAHLGQSAESIEVAARRLESLVLDLVRHAQAEATRAQLALQPVDLATYLSDLLKRRAGAEATRMRLDAAGPARVLADPDQLARIVDNLLSNAEKYSDPGSLIRVRVVVGEADVLVAVTNWGRGIAPEDLPRVFEQGFRTKDAAEQAEGWGVGLYITRGLVEAHGGRISVESDPGRETTFSFTLPRSAS
jgi:signal transduction histidine kinase